MQENLLNSFNSLASLYLQREILISKFADGKKVNLTDAEKKVDTLIKDADLLELIKKLDSFFLITGRDSIKIVEAYRNRLGFFVNRTIGLEEYGSLLPLTTRELAEDLGKEKKKLLDKKDIFSRLANRIEELSRLYRAKYRATFFRLSKKRKRFE